jgi:hypothetical protein
MVCYPSHPRVFVLKSESCRWTDVTPLSAGSSCPNLQVNTTYGLGSAIDATSHPLALMDENYCIALDN